LVLKRLLEAFGGVTRHAVLLLEGGWPGHGTACLTGSRRVHRVISKQRLRRFAPDRGVSSNVALPGARGSQRYHSHAVNASQTLNGRRPCGHHRLAKTRIVVNTSPAPKRPYSGCRSTMGRTAQRTAGLSRDDMSRMVSAGFTRSILLQSASIRLADKARDVGVANAPD
jgi:hypothetical protein